MSRFLSIFKEDNTWSEKTIVGASSFAIMVLTAIVDIATGVFGVQLRVYLQLFLNRHARMFFY